MKRNGRIKTFIGLLLAVMMALTLLPMTAFADEKPSFPLMTYEGTDYVADVDTLYVAEVQQDPATQLITVSFKVFNGKTTSPLVIEGMGVALGFDSSVVPYEYDPAVGNTDYNSARFYTGGLAPDNTALTRRYLNTPIAKFSTLGATLVSGNDTDGRFISAKVSSGLDPIPITVAPGTALTIANIYFMPSAFGGIVNINSFRFRNAFYNPLMLSAATWIGNGSRYMVSNRSFPSSTYTYVVSPTSFKMHYLQSPPTGLSANISGRVVNGYNTATMEWAYAAAGTYYNTTPPIVLDGDHSIYVRKPATTYSGSDEEYVNYKMYLASDPVKLDFPPRTEDAIPELTKTSTNKTTHTDGRVHVGDTLEYTVTAKNDGIPVFSIWADAVMVDTLPVDVTFADNVRLDGVALPASGYTISGRTLTVPLGNIFGGNQRVVTFDVTVNADAYGATIQNSVTVNGKNGTGGPDANKGPVTDGPGNSVVDRSAPPAINPMTHGQSVVTGTCVAGATVTVTFPNGSSGTAAVTGTTWTINTPVMLERDDIVKARQTELNKDPSIEVQETVSGRPDPVKVRAKASTDLDRSDGTRRVGDTLRYTITVSNTGDTRSLWENIPIEDTLPTQVTFVTGSVTINGASTSAYTFAGGVLSLNIGDLAGGQTKVVAFDAKINDTAYGQTFRNTAKVDGVDVTEPDTNIPSVDPRSPAPTINTVNEGDRVITGTCETTGSPTVTVSFKGSTLTAAATVSGGTWTANVPVSINLIANDEVYAVQQIGIWDPSLPATAVVQGKMPAITSTVKTSANQTSTDDKTRVNDTILFTITVKNIGSVKSMWTNVVVIDDIPDGVTYVNGSVRLDGVTPTYSSFIGRELRVTIGTIPGQVTHVVTFLATVDADAHNKFILNATTVEGKSNGDDPADDDADDDTGGFTITGKSAKPTINDVYRDATAVTGTGVPNAEITVTLPDGTVLPAVTVPASGNWTVPIPGGKVLNTGDQIKAVQKDNGMDPSDPEIVIVKDKTYRAVHGFVAPMVTNDRGLGQAFLDKHAITVELRTTFKTPAPASLTTKATLTGTGSLGEFTFNNVPFGEYVLYIKRPGYLARAMKVTISASTPDLFELVPPGPPAFTYPNPEDNDNGVFRLWFGDVGGDNRVDNEDILWVLQAMRNGLHATHADYMPECDLDANGAVDNGDIMLILERWGCVSPMYAGAADVDHYS
ncbi:MAG: DUF11 domain-containing protein [Oscillospiraceae bacterium]|jgi:uncharacterized repeat protein (TIGR01451 family)|nr:DUF11 domain-containing protein [Oscillospiraceae bacterium]